MISPILSERLKQARTIAALRVDYSISYDIVCSLSDVLPIDSFATLSEAREHIQAINNEYIAMDGRGIRLFIKCAVKPTHRFYVGGM